MSRDTENVAANFLAGVLIFVVGFGVTVMLAGGCDSSSSSYTPSYTPPSSSSDGLDWDAARRAGYSEADIEAAKSYQNIDRLSNKEQEDLIIYNTMRQMGYSESEARQAAYE
jgi:hypothetical protein